MEATSSEMRSSGATRSRPAWVSETRRLLRSNSRTPSACSNCLSCTVSAGCETCSAAAARVKWPKRATARNASMCRSSAVIGFSEYCHTNDSLYRAPARRDDREPPRVMLALLGFATVAAVLAAIMTRRMTPLVALIALPAVAALIGGFGVATSRFAVAGIQQTAPVAAMFVFAILYFGVMTDAGLMDPIVNGILRIVGTHPARIVVGSALLALVVHLDGSGAVTFLVAIPALLPL